MFLVTPARRGIRRLGSEERGSALPIFVVMLPVLLLVTVLAIDLAHAWVHRRHLQTQADAAALAAAQDFQYPCTSATEATVTATAHRYAGDVAGAFNKQIGDPARADTNVFALINQPNFYGQASTDSTVQGICAGAMIDVKVTETDLPFIFRIPSLLGITKFAHINAQARVAMLQQKSAAKTLPLGVPNPEPAVARVNFVDESNGTVLATSLLDKCATDQGAGQATFTNSGSCGADGPVSVPITADDIGVRVALGAASSTVCSDAGVVCYDAGSSNTGLVHIQGFTDTGAPSKSPPLVRSVTLSPLTGSSLSACADAYFVSTTSTCGLGVGATVDFDPAIAPSTDASIVATVGGIDYPVAYVATIAATSTVKTATFQSAPSAAIPLTPDSGPAAVTLGWKQTAGKQGNTNCTSGKPCTGTFGVVQRPFSATDSRSGPISSMQVSDVAGGSGPNSYRKCSSCTKNLIATLSVTTLRNTSSVSERPVNLRATSGSQSQTLDCDPNVIAVSDELINGCGPSYKVQSPITSPCPAANVLRTYQSDPAYVSGCVAVTTGATPQTIASAMNTRINSGSNTCVNPSLWSKVGTTGGPATIGDLIRTGGPRIAQLYIVPFGSFNNLSGASSTIPISGFGTFYVTGWAGSSAGSGDPCVGSGDDTAAAGAIVGHFIKYVDPVNNGNAGSTPCSFTTFGSCVAVLIQ